MASMHICFFWTFWNIIIFSFIIIPFRCIRCIFFMATIYHCIMFTIIYYIACFIRFIFIFLLFFVISFYSSIIIFQRSIHIYVW
uniref:PL83L n=1 Tax=African swine fever virus TaxID=10497 RepID=A0A6G7KTH2_ASF